MKKIYISGAMNGKENYNFKQFFDVATRLFIELEKLSLADIQIINPASISMRVGIKKFIKTLKNTIFYRKVI